jgi:hypothetical protein
MRGFEGMKHDLVGGPKVLTYPWSPRNFATLVLLLTTDLVLANKDVAVNLCMFKRHRQE